MNDWQTNSEIRKEMRVLVRKVIEDHVLGPVPLLAYEDVLLLRREISKAWAAGDYGKRKGYRYVCFCAEVRLALNLPEPLKALEGKVGPPPLKLAGVMTGMDSWALERGAKVVPAREQKESLGELFEPKRR